MSRDLNGLCMSLTGYIGKGMLSCAVAGSIFTSPPPQGILTGIRTIAKDNPGNVLFKVYR